MDQKLEMQSTKVNHFGFCFELVQRQSGTEFPSQQKIVLDRSSICLQKEIGNGQSILP